MTVMATTNPQEGVYEHSEFAGLRNTVPAERFELADLEVAQNVDIDDSLEITRRKGYSVPIIGGDMRSLWVGGGVCLAVRNSVDLIRILNDFTYVTLKTNSEPFRDISYSQLGMFVGWSDGVHTGAVDGSVARSWGLATPTSQGFATSMGGTLRAGTYQFAVTFVRSDQQHSGTGRAESFEVIDGGFSITGIPVSSDPDVTMKAVWVSDTDAEHLYFAGIIPNAQTTFNVVAPAKQTVRLGTQFFSPPPAGQIVREFKGRSLVASGDTLYYSEAYAYELFDLRKNYRFTGVITLVAPMQDGVFVGTDQEVVWLSGTVPEKWKLDQKLGYGSIQGTDVNTTKDQIFDGKGDGGAVVFLTESGICVGLDGGGINNLTQDRFDIPASSRGAAMIRRYKGTTQYVVATSSGEAGTGSGTISAPIPALSAAGNNG